MNFNITSAWRNLNTKTIGSDFYWHIALQNESALHDTAPLLRTYVHGKTLDLGAGKLAWRYLLTKYTNAYYSADFTKEHSDLDFLFDATQSFPIRDNSFSTVFCYSVLEHTPAPWKVLPEIHRILSMNGYAIISVPFLFYLHGAPHDYFRFSKFGIKKMAGDAGFDICTTILNGGIFQFIMNMPSVIISSLLHLLHCSFLIKPATWLFYKSAYLLDKIFDKGGVFTMNIIIVLQKRSTTSA